VIASVALVLASVAGYFFAHGRISLAVALVLGLCYVPLAFLNLTLALAVYVAVLFVRDVPTLSVGPNSIGVLVFLGWLGTLLTRSARPVVLREQSRLLLALALFAVWLTLSVIWARSPAKATEGLQTWLIAVLAFVVAATSLHSPRDVAIIAVAFIAGAVASVAFGAASGALTAGAKSANETVEGGRFTGGGGDPNLQAAGFLVAIFFCVGLRSLTQRRFARVGLLLALIVVTIGFFATQSRGGLLSLAFATVVGVVVLPRQRKRLLGLLGAAGVGLGITAAISPDAIARMTDFGGGSSGRSDIWTVASNIFSGHPWVGVGIGNFQIVEPSFALNSGPLTHVDFVAEEPHLVHNVYLQLLTETGVVGLLIFLVIIACSLRTSWLAAHNFDISGRAGYGDLARAVLMAAIAMLAAQFFISDGEDWRLWILLGLGPVLLSLSRRAPPTAAPIPTLRAQ
jgi:O-antigen ligase